MAVERVAAVFLREADYLVEPNSRTDTGLWLSADPVTRLPRPVTAAELGSAVRRALATSRQGLPHPANWRRFPSSLLRVARLQSWAALQRTADRCEVQVSEAGVLAVPCANGGTRGDERGYHSLEEQAVVVPVDGSDEDLGAAVLLALAACR
jgi:hypothetical protein